jgi:hypothetical protein
VQARIYSKKRKDQASLESKIEAAQDLRQKLNEPYQRLEHLAKRSAGKRLTWLSRPRIHFDSLSDPDRQAQLLEIFGSAQRLRLFKKMAKGYRELPSLENYLRLRENFSEAGLNVAVFNELSNLPTLEPELERLGIPSDLVAGALDAYEPDIDELSLRLMGCLVARDKLPKGGPGDVEKRRQAIGDALVDYLIATMLEAMEKNPIVIPPSLIALIRDRLCGPNPDWAASSRSMAWDINLALWAALGFKPDEKISSRKLSNRLGINRITRIKASRLLSKPWFQQQLEYFRRLVASQTFQQLHAALRVVGRIPPEEKVSPESLATVSGVTLDVAARWVADPEFQRCLEWARQQKPKRVLVKDEKTHDYDLVVG